MSVGSNLDVLPAWFISDDFILFNGFNFLFQKACYGYELYLQKAVFKYYTKNRIWSTIFCQEKIFVFFKISALFLTYLKL